MITFEQLFNKHFTIEDYDKREAVRGQGNDQYHTRKMFPLENCHYRKSIKIIGGIDLNADKFTSEYRKRYFDRYEENKVQNAPYYLTALAARRYNRYAELLHGDKPVTTKPIDDPPEIKLQDNNSSFEAY